MTTDPIDLDAIEARLNGLRSIHLLFAGSALTVADGLALVAEVRRLSDTVERVDWLRRSTAMNCDIVGGYCDMHGVDTVDEGRCGLVAMLDRALAP